MRAAHAAVGADELLERRHLLVVGPVGAVDHHVRAVREAVGPPQVIGRVGPEGGERVFPFDTSIIEVMRPA